MIAIVEYRPSWPSDFEVIAGDLRATLGDKALRVDHIGSTAVPGLCAKDVVDVQVTVHELDGEVRRLLLMAGFVTCGDATRSDHLPPGFEGGPEDWAKFFFMQRPGTRRCNIHVRQAERPNQKYALLFRDFLRADRRTAEAYGELKRRLALSLADAETYPDVKDPAADLIYFAAERWALAAQWKP